jgi:hypothetical protein
MFPRPRRTNGNRRLANVRPPVVRAPRMLRSITSATPIRTQRNKQIVSVPNHNYQLKIHKFFRIISQIITEEPLVINTTTINGRARNELGMVATTTVGEMMAIFSARIYASNPSGTELQVSVHDLEETSTGDANAVSLFEDSCTGAGVAHISFVSPVNNRPTFNRSTTPANYLIITAPGSHVTVDLEMEYVRTPLTTPLALSLASMSETLPTLSARAPLRNSVIQSDIDTSGHQSRH